MKERTAALAPTLVNVGLGTRAYDIVIGRGLLSELGSLIAARRAGAAVAVVTDKNVARLHLKAAERSLSDAGLRVARIIVAAGEGSKSWKPFERVCDALLAERIERGDLVLALGGGVVGDLAGFASAVVRRGVDFVQAPTTLLAQVDSSVGGKTGINSKFGKNLIGVFHQPVLVVADTSLLDTLPVRQFRAGYAEVVKCGLIGDANFFAWLETAAAEIFSGGPARERAIAASCRFKAAIVARDERESGERALLNLGHTFGHALEAVTGYSDRLLHGEAVSIGMALAFAFSARQGLLPAPDAERVVRHLRSVGLPAAMSEIPGDLPDVDAMMASIAQDKKVRRGALTFILARGIGEAFIASDVESGAIRAFLVEQLANR